jgi:hypothetical protein
MSRDVSRRITPSIRLNCSRERRLAAARVLSGHGRGGLSNRLSIQVETGWELVGWPSQQLALRRTLNSRLPAQPSSPSTIRCAGCLGGTRWRSSSIR